MTELNGPIVVYMTNQLFHLIYLLRLFFSVFHCMKVSKYTQYTRHRTHEAHLHTLVDLYPPVVVVVQLFVDVSQRLQTEAVSLAHAWRHHNETGVCSGHTQTGRKRGQR